MEINENTNLYLVGYPGTGKTTVGRLLAKKLHLSFTDVDEFIENRYHKTITRIFEEKGESGFREIERRALQEISCFENIVVSTGGGLPCFFDNMDLMNRTGMTIYLKASVDDLIKRLSGDMQKRPLLKGKNAEELRDFIEENLRKREPFYSQSRFVIDILQCFTKKELENRVDELLIRIKTRSDL